MVDGSDRRTDIGGIVSVVAVVGAGGLVEIMRLADSVTTVGLLVVIVAAFVRGWVVTPREVHVQTELAARLLKERDEWQDVALRAVTVGERTVDALRNGK